MIKRTSKMIIALVLVIAIVGTMAMPAFGTLAAGDTIEYPFRKATAFEYAPTWKGATEQASGDSFHLAEVLFDGGEQDLSGASYVAIEIQNVKGNPGMTFGVLAGNNRWGTYIDGENKAFFVKQDGTVQALNVLYSSINLGTEPGMLLLPISSLSAVSWGDGTPLSSAKSFFMETNCRYNWDWEVKLGEVGLYTGEIGSGTFQKLTTITNAEKKGSYLKYAGEMVFPSDEGVVDYLSGKTISYPFATGLTAFNGAIRWTGPSAGDSAANWQTMFVSFDSATVDLSEATYLAVQYKATAGSPGLTYGIESGSSRYSIGAGMDGKPIYFIGEDGKITKSGDILWGASNIAGGSTGALLIPMTSMGNQWGSDDLTTVKNFLLTTNSQYNWGFEVVIGEIGYYTGNPTEGGEFHKLLDLSKGAKEDKFFVTSDLAENRGYKSVYKVDIADLGDTHIDLFATGKQDNSLPVYVNGALGNQTMTTDTYGDDAFKLVTPGPRDGATDPYAAFTLIDGANFQWAGQKGITFWVRNDSDKEISFNLEFDMNHNDYTNTAGGHNARFNIRQGHRFWLYDVNTGEQQIYMTRPCVTIPVGFEGWVRIPFEAYDQAEWSAAGQGVFNKSLFAAEGSWVQYMCITVNSQDYANKEFSVGKIGTYSTTPYLVSSWFEGSETHKTIPQLMGLEG